MALTIKNLAAVTYNTGRTIPATLTYKPGAGKSAIIKNIILVNKHATTGATVNVKLVKAADSGLDLGTTNLCKPNMAVAANECVILDTEITLMYVDGTYEKVEVTVEGASGLPFGITINGIERDI